MWSCEVGAALVEIGEGSSLGMSEAIDRLMKTLNDHH